MQEQRFDPAVWLNKAAEFAAGEPEKSALALVLFEAEAAAAKKLAEVEAAAAAAKKLAEVEAAAAKKLAEVEAAAAAAKKLAEAEAAAAKKLAEAEAAAAAAEAAKKLTEEKLSHVTYQLLSASGALTSRGVFEHKVQQLHSELSLAGKFNATTTCGQLDKVTGEKKNGAIYKELKDCFQQAVDQHPSLKETRMGDFYVEVWGELSKGIHGRSWTGPDVQVLSSEMEPEHATLVMCLVAKTRLVSQKM